MKPNIIIISLLFVLSVCPSYAMEEGIVSNNNNASSAPKQYTNYIEHEPVSLRSLYALPREAQALIASHMKLNSVAYYQMCEPYIATEGERKKVNEFAAMCFAKYIPVGTLLAYYAVLQDPRKKIPEILSSLYGRVSMVVDKHDRIGTAKRIAFSPDGQTLASLTRNAAVLWNTQLGTANKIITMPDMPYASVFAIGFSPTNNLHMCVRKNCITTKDTITQFVYNKVVSASKQVVSSYSKEYAHMDEFTVSRSAMEIVFAAVTDDNIKIAILTPDQYELMMFDPSKEDPSQALTISYKDQDPNRGCDLFIFNADASVLAVTVIKYMFAQEPNHHYIYLYDTKTGARVTTIKTSYRVTSLAFNNAGTTLAAGYDSHNKIHVSFWDVKNGAHITYMIHNQGSAVLVTPHESMAFSPDDTLLAVASQKEPGEISLWDVASKKKITNLFFDTRYSSLLGGDYPATPHDLKFSPDGSKLALATKGQTFVWDVATLRAKYNELKDNPSLIATGFERIEQTSVINQNTGISKLKAALKKLISFGKRSKKESKQEADE